MKLKPLKWNKFSDAYTVKIPGMGIGYGFLPWYYGRKDFYRILCNGKEIGTANSIKKSKELVVDDLTTRIKQIMNLIE